MLFDQLEHFTGMCIRFVFSYISQNSADQSPEKSSDAVAYQKHPTSSSIMIQILSPTSVELRLRNLLLESFSFSSKKLHFKLLQDVVKATTPQIKKFQPYFNGRVHVQELFSLKAQNTTSEEHTLKSGSAPFTQKEML